MKLVQYRRAPLPTEKLLLTGFLAIVVASGLALLLLR